MSNSKLIVVEGAQGVGKTTITDYIRHSLKYTNLYRLSGTSDSTKEGLKKSKEMYFDLLEYMKKMENKNINLVFDRTFFTEENYCRLGKKAYSFTEVYNELLEQFSRLDFGIYYITLYLKNTSKYRERLNRKEKANIDYAKFGEENSVEQQKVYLEMAKEIKEKYPNIKILNISNDQYAKKTKQKIREFLQF